MKHSRLALIALVAVLAIVALVLPTIAHEGREVGEFEIEFGWRVEPAYTTLFNGPEFTVKEHGGSEAPVLGLEDTLQLEVIYGDRTKLLRIRPVFDTPGHYTADLIPTQPGDYTFRIVGKIGDTDVDESFSSADGEFDTVEPISDIQFP